MRLLFWQTFSLTTAYIVASAYLNLDNYVTQINDLLGTKIRINFPENGILALTTFLITFVLPNLYVFLSLHSMKEDLVKGRIQRDIRIIPQEKSIQIGARNYTIQTRNYTTDQFLGFVLISMFPFLINYSSLALLLLTVVTLVMISLHNDGILTNPYLRFKYHVFTLQSEDKRLHVIMEKGERPTGYVVDWLYDHSVLVGFHERGVKT